MQKITANLGKYNGVVNFDGAAEVPVWIRTEREKWSWVGSHAKTHQPTGQFWQHINAQWKAIENSVNAYNASAEDGKEAQLKKCVSTIEATFGSNRLIRSESPRGVFVLGLAKTDPVAAAMAASMFAGIGISPADAKSLEGAFRALQFDSGIVSNIDSERESLNALRTEWNAEYVDLSANIQAIDGQTKLLKSQIEGLKESQSTAYDTFMSASRKAFEKFIAESQAEKIAIEQTYREHMALKAPVEYWRNKAVDHNSRSKKWGISAAISGLVVVASLAVGTWFLLLTTDKPDYWRLAVLGLFAALGIWLVKIQVRLFISSLHQASDASERVTMVETFLSLMSEGHISRQEDRHLVLQALFRSTLTGLVQDEGSPPTVIDISNRVFKDK